MSDFAFAQMLTRTARRFALVLLVLVACSGGGSKDSTPTAPMSAVPILTTLVVSLTPTSIPVGQFAFASVSGRDQNRNSISTGTVTVTSGDTSVAKFTASGAIAAMSVGQAQIIASVRGLSGQATLTVTSASVASTMAINAGNSQTAAVGSAVTTRPAVKVMSANGNAVSGVTVTFAVASGGGSITGATPSTGSDGIATVGSWTLGAATGPNTLTATVTGLAGNALTFSATAVTSTSLRIVTVSASSAMPMSAVTVNTSGLDPTAQVAVRFSDGQSYSVDVSSIQVTTSSVQVEVPPYINVATRQLGPGTVSLQVIQQSATGTVSSNTFAGFQVQNLPMPAAQTGQTTLGFVNGMISAAGQAQAYAAGTNLNTPGLTTALTAQVASLTTLRNQVQALIQDPTKTFTVGSAGGTPVTVATADLANTDRMIMGMLLAFTTNSSANAASFVGRRGVLFQTTPSSAGCQAHEAASVEQAIQNGDVASWTGFYGAPINSQDCKTAQAITAGYQVWIGSAGLGISLVELAGAAIGVETAAALALPTAALVGTAGILGGGLALVEGELGQPTPGNIATIQQAANIVDNSFKRTYDALGMETPSYAGILQDIYNDTQTLWTAATSSGVPNVFSLATGTTGTGTGTVSANPNGPTYLAGASVTLTATPAAASAFAGWSGACAGTGSCALTMTANESVTATFTANAVAPTIGSFTASPTSIIAGQSATLAWTGITNATTCSIGNGVGTVPCSNANASVRPTATATYTLTVTGAGGSAASVVTVTVTAQTPTYTLTLGTTGTGSGAVSASPPGPTYISGTAVIVVATPNVGSTFAGWSGACGGTGSCVVTMNANESVTATFNASSGSGNGDISINSASCDSASFGGVTEDGVNASGTVSGAVGSVLSVSLLEATGIGAGTNYASFSCGWTGSTNLCVRAASDPISTTWSLKAGLGLPQFLNTLNYSVSAVLDSDPNGGGKTLATAQQLVTCH